MANWGSQSYECDEVMDRVGDVWRHIFDTLSPDRVFRTIEACLKQFPSESIGLLLWRYCGIELPQPYVLRLGCLLTTNHRVARFMLANLESRVLNNAIREVVGQSAQTKRAIGGVVSFFVRELKASIESELKNEAALCLQVQSSRTQSAEVKAALSAELSCLRSE